MAEDEETGNEVQILYQSIVVVRRVNCEWQCKRGKKLTQGRQGAERAGKRKRKITIRKRIRSRSKIKSRTRWWLA
jgi:hypothetical protein